MSSPSLPDPIAACFVAETQGPDSVAFCLCLERGLIADPEIAA